MKIPYFVPNITLQDKKFVLKSLNQRWLTNGPMLKKFEKIFSDVVNTRFAVGVNNATNALHLCLRALKISKNDEVILPTFTFAATASAVNFCGGNPILVDVDSETFNILPNEIEKNVTEKTKAIIVVHYGGQSCDMKEILRISKKYGLPIIEDCAHALGSVFKNKFCGSLGTAGCFSFYPTKIITTGEGGMITTNNKKIYEKVSRLRSHAMTVLPEERENDGDWKYDINDIGYNYRLNEMSSALGLSQLKRVSKINKKRIKIAEMYNKELEDIKGISIPKIKKERNHIYHLYSIKIEKNFHMSRNKLFQKLFKKGISTSVQFFPLHLMSYYKASYKKSIDDFPNSNELKDKILCLPIYPSMNLKHVNYVANQIRGI